MQQTKLRIIFITYFQYTDCVPTFKYNLYE